MDCVEEGRDETRNSRSMCVFSVDAENFGEWSRTLTDVCVPSEVSDIGGV